MKVWKFSLLLRRLTPFLLAVVTLFIGGAVTAPLALAQEAAAPLQAEHRPGGEANLVVPDLGSVSFRGIPGTTLLMLGLIVCAAGLLFGLVIYSQLKKMPVHKSMLEISELIYETCKTYLLRQGRFLLILEVFIGTIMAVYFWYLQHMPALSGIA